MPLTDELTVQFELLGRLGTPSPDCPINATLLQTFRRFARRAAAVSCRQQKVPLRYDEAPKQKAPDQGPGPFSFAISLD
jgi:hypothetical protein